MVDAQCTLIKEEEEEEGEEDEVDEEEEKDRGGDTVGDSDCIITSSYWRSY